MNCLTFFTKHSASGMARAFNLRAMSGGGGGAGRFGGHGETDFDCLSRFRPGRAMISEHNI